MFLKFMRKTVAAMTRRGKTLARISVSSLTVLILLVAQAAAQSFSFSTGNPDGKIATGSRPGPGPGSGPNQETESADDFVLTSQTAITSASFTGLVPTGVSLSDVSEVRVEIYRVFPKDSDVGRTSGPPTFSTSQVPTRVNSPSDVEFFDRDSVDGNLTFATTLLASDFTALNSVDTGIHPKPNNLTGGDGPVTGQEVRFNVRFTDPFELPADHYFFVPQVLLADPNQHFLWLSAPRPIVAPGTPFPAGFTDLQSWIRNADLDPDWLRIGTDIVGGTTFNATFSEAGIELPPCSGPASGGTWKNHGQYVSTVAQLVASFLDQGLITEEQADAIVSSAAESDCGKK
jgi:hypothetical protein